MKTIANYITENRWSKDKDSFSFTKESKETVHIEYKHKYEITVNEYFWCDDESGEKYDLTNEDPNTIYQEHPTGTLTVDLDVNLDIVPSVKVEGSEDLFDEFFTSEDSVDHINGWFEMEYDGNSNKIKGDLPYSDSIKWSEILEKFVGYYQDEYIQEYLTDIIRKC